jgi:hypothetical protein
MLNALKRLRLGNIKALSPIPGRLNDKQKEKKMFLKSKIFSANMIMRRTARLY